MTDIEVQATGTTSLITLNPPTMTYDTAALILAMEMNAIEIQNATPDSILRILNRHAQRRTNEVPTIDTTNIVERLHDLFGPTGSDQSPSVLPSYPDHYTDS